MSWMVVVVLTTVDMSPFSSALTRCIVRNPASSMGMITPVAARIISSISRAAVNSRR